MVPLTVRWSARCPPNSQRIVSPSSYRLALSSSGQIAQGPIQDTQAHVHTRVILISRDRRFLKVAGFLLTRRGADVTTARSVAAAAAMLEEQDGAELVVLDSGDSLRETGEGIADLAERYPDLEVVVVADDAETLPQRLEFRLWPKWQQLDLLLTLVEPDGMTVADADRVAS
jgi:CheY-like chemotaxis protein